MTTSSANNSVFRGFFEKQKLTGPNFINWYRQLRIVLSIKDKLNYLEQPIPPALIVPAGQDVAPEILTAHTAWIKGSKEIGGDCNTTSAGVNIIGGVITSASSDRTSITVATGPDIANDLPNDNFTSRVNDPPVQSGEAVALLGDNALMENHGRIPE
uniref:Zinc finger, CCHC-type n=1 Tax=Tanacetum cinerariifolium TaxID=118510 RepID=A0A6L2KTF6_TANCI|nr:zinc finger, CCHC-type [Tanacetum cinerariifolium]